VEYAVGFAQNGKERMMCFAARSLWVVSFGGTFLLAASLEYGGVQIQAEALFGMFKQG
jgi:hypothetical protein